ncbi:MAG: hypothetical protein HON98_10015 [Chloroflexi bacterium]|nr:hypothetical protein [Chloroflexota bacterium]MBT6988604.1 hypothetical protein [Chloroflexota bacterium]MBT7217553.1 hypothetical protein [Chloroflexota bacterium]
MMSRKSSLKGWKLLILCMILLTACQTPANETIEEVAAELPTAIEITEEPTQVPPTATPLPIDECLSCHLDKDRLIETAKIEEALEAESSGEG